MLKHFVDRIPLANAAPLSAWMKFKKLQFCMKFNRLTGSLDLNFIMCWLDARLKMSEKFLMVEEMFLNSEIKCNSSLTVVCFKSADSQLKTHKCYVWFDISCGLG